MTRPLIAALKGTTPLDAYEFHLHYSSVQQIVHKDREDVLEGIFNDTITQFGDMQQQAVLRATNERLSSWLNVKHYFDLTAQEFRDALAIRYKKPLLGVPSHCDGCGALFDLSRALSCRKGGLVTQRQNEVRNAFGDLASMAWSQVVKEPVVREANCSTDTTALVADLSVRGVWVPQVEASFDIRIIDTDTRSYCIRPPIIILSNAEIEKRRNTNNHVMIGEHSLLHCVYQ